MSGKNDKRSVLVISERYYPENFLVNDLVQYWNKTGLNVTVLTQVPSYPKDRLFPGYKNMYSDTIENGIRVVRFKTQLGYSKSIINKVLNYALFMVRAFFYSLGILPNVSAVFIYHTGPLTQAIPLVSAKLFFRKRTCIWTQDVWPDTVFAYGFPRKGAFAVLLKWFVKYVYRFCDIIFVSSPGFINRLRPYVPSGAIVRFIPQWVPDEVKKCIKRSVGIDTTSVNFIFAGNIGKMQNLENVVKAFSRIDAKKAVLYLLGDGSFKSQLEKYVFEHNIANVIFLGSVPQNQVLGYLEQCDFSILSLSPDPLVSLTIPAKFQTYLYSKKPILTVADGEVAALVNKYNVGLVVNPVSVDAIADGIERMCSLTKEELMIVQSHMCDLLDNEYDKSKSINALTELVLKESF